MNKESEISVGIVSGRQIDALLNTPHTYADGKVAEGPQTFTLADGKVVWNGEQYDFIEFVPTENNAWFEISNVTIGVNFHWERQETQRFLGKLRMIVEGDKLTVVNILPVEDYLMSVISSEMSATASLEFLKAHAVISRSWLLAQIQKNKRLTEQKTKKYRSLTFTDTELIRWYDREDHVNFDVCADDHCQRYQGITRQTTPTVRDAVDATRGLVLLNNEGLLCDARFSKCCGGVFEEFETCWEPVHHHYLIGQRDAADEQNFPDLRNEEEATKWILSSPEAYCNTKDAAILGQVLNNYDQETVDFYRWTVSYKQDELAELIKTRSGIDFGAIKALEPVERGTSGRLLRLRIVGTKKTLIIGKELEIRRTLSTSHLYSSAFVVEPGANNADGLPESFTLRGAGWGHGVGLCQIGAAVMESKGMDYSSILMHYFPGAELKHCY